MLTENVQITAPNVTTQEGAALALMQLIARAEGVSFDKGYQGQTTREWILSTYRECLATVKGSSAPVHLHISESPPQEGERAA